MFLFVPLSLALARRGSCGHPYCSCISAQADNAEVDITRWTRHPIWVRGPLMRVALRRDDSLHDTDLHPRDFMALCYGLAESGQGTINEDMLGRLCRDVTDSLDKAVALMRTVYDAHSLSHPGYPLASVPTRTLQALARHERDALERALRGVFPTPPPVRRLPVRSRPMREYRGDHDLPRLHAGELESLSDLRDSLALESPLSIKGDRLRILCKEATNPDAYLPGQLLFIGLVWTYIAARRNEGWIGPPEERMMDREMLLALLDHEIAHLQTRLP